MPTVLVIEDEKEINLLLEELLVHFGYRALFASTGAEGLDLARRQEPDLVLLDLGLPDMSGIDVIRELRSWSAAPLLVLSGTSRRGSRADALDAGADDFLQKPFEPRELAARLRAVARRAATSQDDGGLRRCFGRVCVDVETQRLLLDGTEERLTSIEWRLLEALTRHPGRLLTHRWLVTQVWDATHGAETQTSLRVHMRSLRSKLHDEAKEPHFVRTESGVGYRWIASATAAVVPSPVGGPGSRSTLDELEAAVAALQVAVHTAAAPGNDRDAALGRAAELARRAGRLVRDARTATEGPA
ncbi:response regulator transcription factor [Nocardioides sp.]|uniref:response regulator transcription factor n=1 Tax=Nocardioides sp. TaxID=35761 RepID=UPI00286BCD24|nr:response regulator transcription factor [Nocardioides sp.]